MIFGTVSTGSMRAEFLGTVILLVAACGCSGRDTCTTNGDCSSGHVCAGPEQGPFQCYQNCEHTSCASGETCTNLTLADPLGGGATAMACFLDTTPPSDP